MAHLPFLIVHGALVWKVLVVGLALGTLRAIAALRNRSARFQAGLGGVARGAAVIPLAEGNVCLLGRLRGGSIATLSKGELRENLVDGAPWIEADGGVRVVFPADRATVTAPARATNATFGVPRGTPAKLRARAKGSGWSLGTIADGDPIVVTGVATRAPDPVAGYRDDATTWTLAPNEDGVVSVSAALPTAVATPYSPASVIAGFAAVGLVWFGVLHFVGSTVAKHAQPRGARATATEIAPFGGFAIAAALPGSRDDVIEELVRSRSDRGFVHRGSVLPIQDALDDFAGGCFAASRKLDTVRLDAALASARSCGDRELEAAIQMFRGDYAAALALDSKRPELRERAAIGAGDWKTAASAADAIASGPAIYTDAAYEAKRVVRDRCVAALLHSYAGDRDPFAPVNTLTGSAGPAICRFVGALAATDDPQRSRLQELLSVEKTVDFSARDYRIERLATTLLAYTPDESIDEYTLDADIPFGISASTWMIADAPLTAPNAAIREARIGTEIERGDFAAAHAELAAFPAATDHGSYQRETAALTLALREGTPMPDTTHRYIHPMFEDTVALRNGTLAIKDATRAVNPESCGDELGAAVSRALDGDGGPLATVFSECSVYYIYMPRLLFGILPHVKQHRAELADALRVFRDSITTYSFEHVPARLIQDLADYRDTARLVGDDEEADRMQAIVARHAKVLGDPKRALLFALLDD